MFRHSHTDKSAAPWTIVYTPSFEAGQTVCDSKGQPFNEDEVQGLQSCGLDFVSLAHRVIVRGAADTLWAFKSRELHGTTPACGVANTGIALTLSEHIIVAHSNWCAAGKPMAHLSNLPDGHLI